MKNRKAKAQKYEYRCGDTAEELGNGKPYHSLDHMLGKGSEKKFIR